MGRIKAPTSATTVPKQKPAHLFKPGQSGNPAGRPAGSKNKLTENILFDLSEFYEKEGKDLIRRVRDENPAALLQGLLKLIPKDISLNVSGGVELELTVDQRTRIAESWLMSQSDRMSAIEGEAVRVIESESLAALPRPDSEQDDDDLDRIVPERECEPVKMKQDDDLFERDDARQYQPRPGRRAKIISTGTKRND
jgi:hypothetical protein